MFAGEGDDGQIGAFALLEISLDRVEILDGPLDAAGDDHGSRLAVDLSLAEHLLVEMIHHDLGLLPDGMLV